jgi:hypothetical protein
MTTTTYYRAGECEFEDDEGGAYRRQLRRGY